MAETALGLFELVVVFGGLLAFGVWELYSLRRDKRRAEREAEKLRPLKLL